MSGERARIIRFLAVGILNTAFSYLIYSLLLFIGLHFAFANFGALVLSVLFSFNTQRAFVFGRSGSGAFTRFVLAWLVIYVMNVALIGALVSARMNAYLAGAIAIGPSAVASYLMQRFVVFRLGTRTEQRSVGNSESA